MRHELILKKLRKEYPKAKTALKFRTPFQMLVATILSAQCTDKRVNEVTKTLFKKYKTPKDYAEADKKEFEKEIKPTGFYKNKAKNIINAAKKIVEKYNGRVPKTIKELTSLPGVGRKTANIVLNSAFGIAAGIAVDTHVKRLSQRLGFTKNKDPNKIEQDLMKIFPKKDWHDLNFLLVEHGRKICKARKPLCEKCVINKLCPSAFKIK